MRKKRTPGYLLHKQSGQARVRIDGKDHMLGTYGSAESKAEYERLIALWRQQNQSGIVQSTMTVGHLIVLYLRHAEEYYRKGGEPTSEVGAIKSALRWLKQRHGTTPLCDFGPLKLKQVRQDMVDAERVRRSINKHVGRIIAMLRWGVENEYCIPQVYSACQAVKPLAIGRTDAVEGDPVLPVPPEHIEAVQPHVSRQVWGMIRLQLETGMRPQEVREIRLCDLDKTHDDCWEYIPARHKTQHHGKERRIFLNVLAQEIVGEFTSGKEPSDYLFSPADASREALAKRVSRATTHAGNTRAVDEPKRKPKGVYSKDSYRRAIQRACDAASVPRWSPNQLRHNSATELEQYLGDDAARCVLGHSSKSTTEIYIERDFAASREAMRKMAAQKIERIEKRDRRDKA